VELLDGPNHPEHLNTPRLVADSTGTSVWRWDQQEPFGVNAPDENPSSLGAFEFPLRFPGQYADKETGLHYNYFRDYDAGAGRYVQSDPVGLVAGLNTYIYASVDPLSKIDPKGLLDCFVRGDCYRQADSNYKSCTNVNRPGIYCAAMFGRCLLLRNPILIRACIVTSSGSCAGAQFLCINQQLAEQTACDQGLPIDGYQFGENYGEGPDCKCYSRPRLTN